MQSNTLTWKLQTWLHFVMDGLSKQQAKTNEIFIATKIV
jgi:hypothetical protein